MRSKALWAGLVAAACVPVAAWAASLHVAPVTVQMDPGQSSAMLTLRNQGDKRLQALVRVFAWSQQDGQDKLAATETLLASPPTMAIAPQGSQTIRLARVARSAVAREEAYRVLIDEIPDPAAPGRDGGKLQLRYSIPVFVSPAGMTPARVTANASVDGQALVLEAHNDGGQHAQVSALTLVDGGGEAVLVEAGLVGYVLVGQTMQWRLAIPPGAAAKRPFVSLRCLVNGHAFSTPL